VPQLPQLAIATDIITECAKYSQLLWIASACQSTNLLQSVAISVSNSPAFHTESTRRQVSQRRELSPLPQKEKVKIQELWRARDGHSQLSTGFTRIGLLRILKLMNFRI
jgi:hypothetical protein